MRKSRKELEKMLNQILKDIKHDKVKVESVKNVLGNHGIIRGEVQKIIIGKTPIESFETDMLCLVTIAIHKATGVRAISPLIFFTDKEVDDAEKLNLAVDKVSFPIVFNNVLQTEMDGYVAFESAKKLIKLYNSDILEYNYNITRNFKIVKKVSGQVMKVIDINMREVKSIAKAIENNNYSVGKILINIVKNGSKLHYNKDSRNLVVGETKIDVINGIHEISALSYIMASNPNFDVKVQIELKNYTLEQIQTYFNHIKLKGGVN